MFNPFNKLVAQVGGIKVYRKGWLNPIYRATLPNGTEIWDESLSRILDTAEVREALIQLYSQPFTQMMARDTYLLQRFKELNRSGRKSGSLQ